MAISALLSIRTFLSLLLLFGLLHIVALRVAAQPVTQPFTFSLVPHTLPQVEHAVTALGDFDGDGDLDVYLSGIAARSIVVGVFRNEGLQGGDTDPTWVFEETASEAPPLVYGAAAWGDYDADGDLDLVVTGSTRMDPPYDPQSVLLRNEGGELRVVDEPLAGYHSGDAIWGDFDNDGDLDLLLGGETADRSSETRLYRNEAGRFSDAEVGLPGLAYGDAAWGDADGDNDLDLVMSGVSTDGIYADVFLNDGGDFSVAPSELVPSAFSDVNWGDFDEDGDLDLIQTGGRFSPNVLDGLTRLYENSAATFDSLEVALPGAVSGAGTWGDYDNDGDLDLLVMGGEGDIFGRRRARIYAHEESGYAEKIHFVGVVLGSASWGDLDGDGDLDLVASGKPTVGDAFVNIYENRRQVVTAPETVSKLEANVSGGSVSLRWSPPSLGSAATYNIRVGTATGRGDVVAPMSDPETGQRLVPAAGNAQVSTSWRLEGLEVGSYYWSVQTVDPALTASAFAPEQRFTIAQSTAAEREAAEWPPIETRLHPATPNPSLGRVSVYYDLEEATAVTIRVYDLLGRAVATLVDEEMPRGRHRAEWDGRDAAGRAVASGLYLCEFLSADHRQTISMVVAR